ncbi:hypothetical protein BU24DRAFT_419345 [Aaosphaeria arxii CBS 175.79]|uniref:Uncharacterized protein n=1 Tax=Aaosphaeria arxii CBS 175.79 TaxID=1450172 RepID=A0A6A5Y2N3_9PLEO|nr:uncharacterized protein BU24DRAFT_419345 [Aaosphaeria arxii CBS 175.79]KAF2019718.1 hypothetical protein BU24DRAFT_419345 [Aaosphaeria arxii CBS 175.79]
MKTASASGERSPSIKRKATPAYRAAPPSPDDALSCSRGAPKWPTSPPPSTPTR